MISIPNKVKDLFGLDHCRKNLRIHFPDGERNDLIMMRFSLKVFYTTIQHVPNLNYDLDLLNHHT